MGKFRNKIREQTAKEFFDSVEDKDSYYWETSGIHTYNIMLQHEEQKIKEQIEERDDLKEVLEKARKLKFNNDKSGLNKLLNSLDFVTREYVKKQLNL